MATDQLFSLAKSYCFADVVLTVNGIRIQGFGDDGGVTIEPDGDDGALSQGADGEVTLTQFAPPPFKATIKLKQTSTSNGVLAGLRALQRSLGVSLMPCPFSLLDPGSGETLLSPQAIFMGRPSVSMDKEASDREWVLGLPNPAYLATPDPLA